LQSAKFTDENNGTTVGGVEGYTSWGDLMNITNGGRTWNYQHMGNHGLFSVEFSDKNHGIAVGGAGVIFKTTNGGATFIEEESNIVKPGDYVLYQNYPNPFNPSTRIEYSLPYSGKVSLNIYSIIGELVAKIIDKYEADGNHSVMFNAKDLASGMYIYRLGLFKVKR
jgi:hypothetical protein